MSSRFILANVTEPFKSKISQLINEFENAFRIREKHARIGEQAQKLLANIREYMQVGIAGRDGQIPPCEKFRELNESVVKQYEKELNEIPLAVLANIINEYAKKYLKLKQQGLSIFELRRKFADAIDAILKEKKFYSLDESIMKNQQLFIKTQALFDMFQQAILSLSENKSAAGNLILEASLYCCMRIRDAYGIGLEYNDLLIEHAKKCFLFPLVADNPKAIKAFSHTLQQVDLPGYLNLLEKHIDDKDPFFARELAINHRNDVEKHKHYLGIAFNKGHFQSGVVLKRYHAVNSPEWITLCRALANHGHQESRLELNQIANRKRILQLEQRCSVYERVMVKLLAKVDALTPQAATHTQSKRPNLQDSDVVPAKKLKRHDEASTADDTQTDNSKPVSDSVEPSPSEADTRPTMKR